MFDAARTDAADRAGLEACVSVVVSAIGQREWTT
jgi:hypothetical protein